MGQEHKEYTWNLIAKKFTGEASPEELQELEALLRGNPELHYPMQTMTDLWRSSSPEDKKMAEQALDRHLERMGDLHIDFIPLSQAQAETITGSNVDGHLDTASELDIHKIASPTRRRKKPLAAMSIFSLLLITCILIYTRTGTKAPAIASTPPASTGPRSEVTTRNGSRTNMVLPDGTQVWLNAGSRITYDKNYGTASREVNLTGEAFFDVAHNAGKPFVIHAARVDIKVLGTRFNVKSYPSDKTTETTLIRGSIEVSIKDRPTEKIILKPNEKLVVANDDSTLHRKNLDHPDQTVATNESLVSIRKPTYEPTTGTVIETSWVDNKLIFQDETFADLARQMERWYGVVIRFSNPKEEELRFTGIFANETIQQALEALKLTGAPPFDYTMNENIITIHDK